MEIQLPPKDNARLADIARKTDRPESEIVRDVMGTYLDGFPAPAFPADVAAADRVENELRRVFVSLAGFAGQGHWRRELSGRLRFWPIWDYLIAYRPEPPPILIAGVLHGRRNPDTLAKILATKQRPENIASIAPHSGTS